MTGAPVGNIGNEAEYREAAKAFWSDVFGIPTGLIAEKVMGVKYTPLEQVQPSQLQRETETGEKP